MVLLLAGFLMRRASVSSNFKNSVYGLYNSAYRHLIRSIVRNRVRQFLHQLPQLIFFNFGKRVLGQVDAGESKYRAH